MFPLSVIHLLNCSVPVEIYIHISVSELLTHVSMGNNFHNYSTMLCAVPFAFGLIDRSMAMYFVKLVLVLLDMHSPFSRLATFNFAAHR